MDNDEVAGNVEYVRRGCYQFGDIVRILPVTDEYIPNRDDRRWMILTTAALGRPWRTLYLNPGHEPVVIDWSSLTGFERVDE